MPAVDKVNLEKFDEAALDNAAFDKAAKRPSLKYAPEAEPGLQQQQGKRSAARYP